MTGCIVQRANNPKSKPVRGNRDGRFIGREILRNAVREHLPAPPC
jgi:hypothetical protein